VFATSSIRNGSVVLRERGEESRFDLEDVKPVSVEDALTLELFHLFHQCGVHPRRRIRRARNQRGGLLLIHELLGEYLGCLGHGDPDEKVDDLATEVGGWGVEKVVVDVGEHPG
jgi:hypothetical protein